jgi:hypothetical protein
MEAEWVWADDDWIVILLLGVRVPVKRALVSATSPLNRRLR